MDKFEFGKFMRDLDEIFDDKDLSLEERIAALTVYLAMMIYPNIEESKHEEVAKHIGERILVNFKRIGELYGKS